MNKQLFIKILIIVLIVCSILLLFMFVSNNNNSNNSNKKETYDDYNEKIDEAVKYINIPVASQDIKEGTVIDNNLLSTKKVRDVDDKYYSNFSDIIGKVSTKDIKEGEMFSEDNIMFVTEN